MCLLWLLRSLLSAMIMVYILILRKTVVVTIINSFRSLSCCYLRTFHNVKGANNWNLVHRGSVHVAVQRDCTSRNEMQISDAGVACEEV
uniref:Uncharacterized protein n=1 Tax=Solanum lycopersicum TaxID=4081 RepID=A0A3Q7G6V7_SOLLC